MGDNTKQKKLARERQARTGESYTEALMHVRVEALATRSTENKKQRSFQDDQPGYQR